MAMIGARRPRTVQGGILQLYKIADQYAQAIGRGLESEADAEALTRELEAITDTFAVKAEAVVGYIRNLDSEAEAFKAESDRLAARGKALQANSERLKKYLEYQMRRIGTPELRAGLNTLKMVKNPWSVDMDVGAEALPGRYQHWKVEADKVAIKAALQAGLEILGCRLTQGERLKIS